MKVLKYFVFAFFGLTAEAQQTITLSELKLQDDYLGIDSDGYSRDFSGNLWNTSHLYASQEPEFSGGIAINYFDGTYIHKLSYNFDFGKKSLALNAEPVLSFGYGRAFQINKKTSFKWEVRNLIQVGGKVWERSCIDEFQRVYHCGTALPWSDAVENLKQKNSFPLIYSFDVTTYF